MSKRFILLWVLFWTLVSVVIIYFRSEPALPEYEEICVGFGDRAWSIAKKRFPGEDPRQILAQMEKLNAGKDITQLKPGDIIRIPKKTLEPGGSGEWHAPEI